MRVISMKTLIHTATISLLLLLPGSLLHAEAAAADKAPQQPASEVTVPDPIRAYCLDYNWGKKGPAKPGQYTSVSPKPFIEWHKRMNINVIQTFSVSLNGYAWYDSEIVPKQPGLDSDFLTEVVKLGHAEGMKVIGYYCFANNRRWAEANPGYSYDVGTYQIPYTDKYLEYLTAIVKESVVKTGIDGIMIDWFWQPTRTGSKKASLTGDSGKDAANIEGFDWLECEKQLFEQLMGKPFPGVQTLSSDDEIAYSRKALDRAWKTVRKAVKEANPEAILWLTANKITHPHVINSDMYKEVDWLMDEAGRLESLEEIRHMAGEHTQLITCFAEWNGADPTLQAQEAMKRGIGLYGFGRPNSTGLIPLNPLFENNPTTFVGNQKNVATLARIYNGTSPEAQWVDGRFVEPQNPLSLRIEFEGGRKGMGSRGELLRAEEGHYVADIFSIHGAGLAALHLKPGQTWPNSITLKIKHHQGRPSQLRQIAFSDGKTALIGDTTGERKAFTTPYVDKKEFSMGRVWQTQFIDRANVKAAPSLVVRKGDDYVEVDVPKDLFATQPETLIINWSRERDGIKIDNYLDE